MKLFLVLMVSVLGFLTQAQATPTLVVTSGKKEGVGVRYFYSITNWSTEDRERTELCGYNDTHCNMLLYAQFDGGMSFAPLESWTISVGKYEGPMTLGDLLFKFNSRGDFIMPFKSSILVYGYGDAVEDCLFLTLASPRNSAPLTSCASVVRPPTTCEISGYTTIDHKKLSDNQLDGAQASTQLSLKCDRSASVLVSATRTNSYGVRLRNDDSLYSVIKINSEDATNGINLQGTSINVTSTLKTRSAVAPGPFSGSTVLTVAPY